MKVALVALLFAASALAQGSSANPAAACGFMNVSFKVKLDDTQHTLTQPEAGKAVVYIIHDAGSLGMIAYPTTKFAVDGSWMGANHGDSYFSVAVDPGEHHLCTALQSSLV